MPKITVEYEVTHRIAVEVEVSEETVRKLNEEYSLGPLKEYGITPEDLYAQCEADGWSEDDYAVTDSRGYRIIPWRDE